MISYDFPAYEPLERAVEELGSLADELLFVGGATIGFYVTEIQVRAPRPTEDIDTVCNAVTLVEYYGFADRLRAIGFREDETSRVICRWLKDDIVLDLMPIDESVLGFRNRWYEQAMAEPWTVVLRNGKSIQIPTPALALACKLEAFADRGRGDFMISKDFEDIVVLVDGRAELVSEMGSASGPVRELVRETVKRWLKTQDFSSSIAAHLPPDAARQSRREVVLSRLRALAQEPIAE